MNQLHLGDCLEVLKTLPENSVDSIVTDPPYGLSAAPNSGKKSTGGFMGKKWDYDVPSVEIWKECLRVLKPGGHLLAFSGSRTYHRMAVRIEDAGFEIRDMIAWVYGCLSDDTEILTKNGWVRYDKSKESRTFAAEEILIYDKDSDSFGWEVPEKWNEYKTEQDTAYRIQSDSTDQIVSRGHRCLVEREGELLFVGAESLQEKESVPVLEILPNLQHTVLRKHERAGYKEQVLLESLRIESYKHGEHRENKRYGRKAGGGMLCMWKGCSKAESLVKKGFEANLFKSLQWKAEGRRMGKACLQRAFKLVGGKRENVEGKDDRKYKPVLEGWRYLFQKKRQVRSSVDKVCEVSERIYRDGKKRRLCNGTPTKGGSGNREAVETLGVCSSHKSRCDRQQDRKPDAICEQQRPQEVRTRPSYKTTLASVTKIKYTGTIFCPTVSTGAFVARRNGKIFITGNSGFPKSLDVGKAVDKLQGNEREDLGFNENSRTNKPESDVYEAGIRGKEARLSKGQSEWEGWGTSLKPALEPITLARKPLSEKTVAENVLKWGTGGINIDACRIPINKDVDDPRLGGKGTWSSEKMAKNVYEGGYAGERVSSSELGRFPANLIHDGSDEVLDVFPENSSRFFYCPKTTKKDRNEGCEGLPLGEPPASARSNPAEGRESALGKPRQNNHPTVKPTDLMLYLIRLVTPKGGTTLDPFMGSGSTGKAAARGNFKFIGIEREQDFYNIAQARITHEAKKPKQQTFEF